MKKVLLFLFVTLLTLMMSSCTKTYDEEYIIDHTQLLIPDCSYAGLNESDNMYQFTDENGVGFSVFFTDNKDRQIPIELPLCTDYVESVISSKTDELNMNAPEGITVDCENSIINLYISEGVSLIDIADYCVLVDDIIGFDLNIYEESVYFSDSFIKAHCFDSSINGYVDSDYILMISKSSSLDYDITFDEAYRWITVVYQNVVIA